MEKEEEDVYSPSGVLEDYLRSLESESTSSKESCLELEDQKISKPVSRWAALVQLLKSRSKRPLGNLHSLNVLKLSKRFSSTIREAIAMSPSPIIDTDLSYFKPHWKNFTTSELQIATNNFAHG